VSKSRRKTPVFGITTAESDKEFKRREHKRERTVVRDSLAVGVDVPHPKQFGNPWASEKDGKRYWHAAEAKDMRK
jgi:hypothetical protein